MKRLQKILDIQYDALHKDDWDNNIILTGDEGKGKSNLVLGILEYWLGKKYKEVKKKDIRYINLDMEKWADSLAECNNGDMVIRDESGDISNRRSMSKINVAISQAYGIIRGDNINSVFVLPSIFDLDSYFAKRRARCLIHVYKRGKFACWSQQRLRKIVELNSGRPTKKLWVVKPNFVDNFPIYKGILKEEYMKKKIDYMKDTRKELAKTIKDLKGQNEMSERDQIIIRIKNKLGTTKASELIGLSDRQVRRICQQNTDTGQADT